MNKRKLLALAGTAAVVAPSAAVAGVVWEGSEATRADALTCYPSPPVVQYLGAVIGSSSCGTTTMPVNYLSAWINNTWKDLAWDATRDADGMYHPYIACPGGNFKYSVHTPAYALYSNPVVINC